ncbi:MAG: DUF2934 domain-containing protein [Gammaproteobacteria bacterium]|nr:DUF2934 domain-containing protein [Gammaproteobacteria bacterium]
MSKIKEKKLQKKRRKKSEPTKSRQRTIVVTERYTMIAEAAYFIAEHRGFTEGNEIEDWLQAEKEVDTLQYLGQF